MSYRVTGSTGTVATAKSAELDPVGRNAGSHAPFGSSPPPRLAPEKTYPGFGAEGLGLCTLDGVDVACGLAFELLYRRGANFDPNVSGPDPGTIINIPGIGRIVWVPGDDSVLIGSGSHQNPDGTYTAHVEVSGGTGGHFETIGGMESAHAGQQQTSPLSPKHQKKYDDTKNKLLKRLGKSKEMSKCADFLARAGITISDVVDAVNNIKAYDGRTSSISAGEAGIIDLQDPEFMSLDETHQNQILNQPVSAFFGERSVIGAVTGTGDRVFFNTRKGFSQKSIFHEALHVISGVGDVRLARALKLDFTGGFMSASIAINNALKKYGCVK